ncbi:MAG TPA: PQQ-dependent sugar dehydrogenase, partial [Tepidisphaeraceae bacterium]|nr:PQQ-dependent sugar dehydrogenase [Tepidisphaeraceae bacterium]
MQRLTFIMLAVAVLTPVARAQNAGVEQLYSNNCMSCHGNRGQGGGAGTRTLLTDELFKQEHDRRFFDAIKQGLPDSGMEAFGETLDDAQVWGLVGYIRELQYRAYRARVGSLRPDGTGVFQTQHHAYRVEKVIERGLDTPWSVDFLPDGRMLVADRPGELRIHSTGKPGGALSKPIVGTPKVRNQGQGGLMEVTVHPDYSRNGWIYLAYSHAIDGNGMTRIVRGKLSEAAGGLKWTDEQVIFQARPEHYSRGDLHFGCRIVFDPNDPSILFFCIG